MLGYVKIKGCAKFQKNVKACVIYVLTLFTYIILINNESKI